MMELILLEIAAVGALCLLVGMAYGYSWAIKY
jgi:hypothetical protein